MNYRGKNVFFFLTAEARQYPLAAFPVGIPSGWPCFTAVATGDGSLLGGVGIPPELWQTYHSLRFVPALFAKLAAAKLPLVVLETFVVEVWELASLDGGEGTFLQSCRSLR